MTLKSFLKYNGLVAAMFLVSCGGGSSKSSVTSPPPPPPPAVDTTAPVVTFAPTTLTVESGATGSSVLTANDNVAITTGPTVVCTNGGAFAADVFTAPTVTAETTSVCTASASDAAGNTGTANLTVTVTAPPPPPPTPPTSVDISGKVTFDSVPHNTTTNGLNYAATTQKAARGVTIEALSSTGGVLASSVTDAAGDYSLTVDSNTDVRIRAKAEMISTATAKWNVKTTDNTNDNAVYALQGTLTSSGAADSTRNLNAASGWGGSSYSSTRAAAPFAILDPIYDAVNAFAAVDMDIDFPAMEFRWSTLNRAEQGSLTTGQIGTSFYSLAPGSVLGNVYILGDENGDTDEYDSHVVVHEWGHYFEDQIARSDSIGGNHTGSDILDPRVAMGEGWGNALSGMITGDSFYRDSSQNMQASGFSVNVESNIGTNPGWYNEASVQSILYDLFDSAADGSDNIALGLGPIYEVFTSANYKNQSQFTTIFSFISELLDQQPGSAAGINAVVSAQSIDGTGPQGSGETNAGGVTNSLPIYTPLAVNGAAVQICSNDVNGAYNKLGNRQYLTVNFPTAGSYTMTMTKTSGPAIRDPDFNVFKDGAAAGEAGSGATDVETFTQNFEAGDHVIDAFEFNNIQPGTSGATCFNFTVTG